MDVAMACISILLFCLDKRMSRENVIDEFSSLLSDLTVSFAVFQPNLKRDDDSEWW